MIKRYSLAVVLKGPIFTRSNNIGLFGIDAPVARNAKGVPYLPNTLVIGRLAEAFRQLGAVQRQAASARAPAGKTCLDDLRDFFAAGEDPASPGDETHGRSRRRRIFVSDLTALETGLGASIDAIRTRIAIDGSTGSVKPGAIQVIEAPYKIGEEVTFVGEVRLLGDEARLTDFEPRLSKVLSWIGQWGGLRGLGYGEAVSATLKAIPARSVEPSNPSFDRMLLVLDMKDPFCVGENRIDANTYMSSDVISGGVVKGAIASQVLAGAAMTGTSLRQARAKLDPSLQPLAEFVDVITVRHAMPLECSLEPKPGEPQHRTAVLPRSLAIVSLPQTSEPNERQDKIIDAARLDRPAAAFLFGGKAPRFQPDWKGKHHRIAAEKFGLCSVPSTLRLRTKIDAESRTAETGKLFGIRYRDVHLHRWVAEIDLRRVPADRRAAVWAALRATTQNGLAGIGRGGAFAEVEIQPSSPPPRLEPDGHGRYAAMLRTPALIRKPDPEARDDVTTDYATAFADLAGPSAKLTLKAIFVGERLAGADFMARRLPTGTPYRPFLLTEAGSVFVFDADAAGQAALQLWLDRGVPIPPATLAFYALAEVEDLWSYCPYLPENGFGEIIPLPTRKDDALFVAADDVHLAYVPDALTVIDVDRS